MTVKSELVWLKDDSKEVVTDSLHVAEVFGKKHHHVMDSIKALIAEIKSPEVSGFCKSADTSVFLEDSYSVAGNKRKYPKYYMNKDGFTLLVMGFTGKKALQFKLKYIEAFNAMEKQLKQLAEQPVQQINTDQDKMVSKLLNYVDFLESKLDELTGKLKEPVESVKQLLPDVSVFEQIYQKRGKVLASDIGQVLGLSNGWQAGRRLNELLAAAGVLEKTMTFNKYGNHVSAWKISEAFSYLYSENRAFHMDTQNGQQLFWTPEGAMWAVGMVKGATK